MSKDITWEELCEKAKDMGYVLEGCDEDVLYQYEPIQTGLHFRQYGKITYGEKVIIEDRTPKQMLMIMEALR